MPRTFLCGDVGTATGFSSKSQQLVQSGGKEGGVPLVGDSRTWRAGCFGKDFFFSSFSYFRSSFLSIFFSANRSFSISILYCREATHQLSQSL